MFPLLALLYITGSSLPYRICGSLKHPHTEKKKKTFRFEEDSLSGHRESVRSSHSGDVTLVAATVPRNPPAFLLGLSTVLPQ